MASSTTHTDDPLPRPTLVLHIEDPMPEGDVPISDNDPGIIFRYQDPALASGQALHVVVAHSDDDLPDRDLWVPVRYDVAQEVTYPSTIPVDGFPGWVRVSYDVAQEVMYPFIFPVDDDNVVGYSADLDHQIQWYEIEPHDVAQEVMIPSTFPIDNGNVADYSADLDHQIQWYESEPYDVSNDDTGDILIITDIGFSQVYHLPEWYHHEPRQSFGWGNNGEVIVRYDDSPEWYRYEPPSSFN
ncbi:hypothetical protein F4782DRAFT_416892 [Xylaria castorea]|nr:hypothetical protein F4782DRAFT_416892 [Xylaria castorea]